MVLFLGNSTTSFVLKPWQLPGKRRKLIKFLCKFSLLKIYLVNFINTYSMVLEQWWSWTLYRNWQKLNLLAHKHIIKFITFFVSAFPPGYQELLLQTVAFIELTLATKNLCSYAQGNLRHWPYDILSPLLKSLFCLSSDSRNFSPEYQCTWYLTINHLHR